MIKAEIPSVKKETLSVKTFRSKKSVTYLQCDNAYHPAEHPYCHNTIKDGEEYLVAICKFDDGYTMRYGYCEGCMRAEFSEEEVEKARSTKKTQAEDNRIQTLVDEIRRRLKTYDGNDKVGLAAMETALDEIISLAKGESKHDGT